MISNGWGKDKKTDFHGIRFLCYVVLHYIYPLFFGAILYIIKGGKVFLKMRKAGRILSAERTGRDAEDRCI